MTATTIKTTKSDWRSQCRSPCRPYATCDTWGITSIQDDTTLCDTLVLHFSRAFDVHSNVRNCYDNLDELFSEVRFVLQLHHVHVADVADHVRISSMIITDYVWREDIHKPEYTRA